MTALKATYAVGESWADPDGGGAVVIEYAMPAAMRDELRDAGDAPGYSALHDTWLGKFYWDKAKAADFALLPVECS